MLGVRSGMGVRRWRYGRRCCRLGEACFLIFLFLFSGMSRKDMKVTLFFGGVLVKRLEQS